jgi:peptidoglycan-associated lipoprotein
MNISRVSSRLPASTGLVSLVAVFFLSGCLATRDWVREQMDPVTGRVSQTETRIGEAEGQINQLGNRLSSAESRISGIEGKLSGVDGRVGDADAKAQRALTALGNLKFERRLVIDMKEGANFGFNSSALPPQAKKEIDGFMSDLKGDLAGGENAVFLVAGHTDNSGSDDFNYELGRRRADAVSRYLVSEKKMDPLRVVSVSYGENSPIAENNSRDGRAKNRRVEILVYREAVNSNTATSSEPQKSSQAAPESGQMSRSY